MDFLERGEGRVSSVDKRAWSGGCCGILSIRCPKDYGIPQGLCIGKISGFPRVSGLQLQTRLLRPPCFFFLICRVAALRWQPITSIEFKFVARQVEASVVIRAKKLKFVAESRTRVYFSQHVASICCTAFCCETSCSFSSNTSGKTKICCRK